MFSRPFTICMDEVIKVMEVGEAFWTITGNCKYNINNLMSGDDTPLVADSVKKTLWVGV